jgi:hypothetical protein
MNRMVELNMSDYTVVRGKCKMHWPEIAGDGHKKFRRDIASGEAENVQFVLT